jgi:hypothetical protein
MHSTLNPAQAENPAQADPQRVLASRVDEELAHTLEQIARTDEQIARAEERLSRLEHDAPRHPSDHPRNGMNRLHPAVLGNRPSLAGRALRGFTVLMLTACICAAAIVWQSSHGHAARQIIARWAPQLVSTSSLPIENAGLPAQPGPATPPAVAAQTAPSQAAPLAQTASQDVAPTIAPAVSELTQLVQAMARDLANVGQRIDQLKASQEQMASDNAKAVEQLKASQEQMTRLVAKDSVAKASEAKPSVAKASEQNLRPKTPAPPPRPIAASTRKPVPTLSSQQARGRAQPPVQLQPEEE